MSNKALNHVWQHSKQSGGALVVMLAIADMANDEGDCWPGTTKLAVKCRMKERNLQRILSKVVSEGELIIFLNDGAATAGGKTNRYRVVGVHPNAPPADQGGASQCTGGVHSSTPRQRKVVHPSTPQVVHSNAPDPSLEPLESSDPKDDPPAAESARDGTDPKAAAAAAGSDDQSVQEESQELKTEAARIADLKRVTRHFENNIQMVTSVTAEKLKALIDEYPADWFTDAINEAVIYNARNLPYIEAILKRWGAQGKQSGRKADLTARSVTEEERGAGIAYWGTDGETPYYEPCDANHWNPLDPPDPNYVRPEETQEVSLMSERNSN